MTLLGELRPLAAAYLTAILEFILTALVSHSFPHESAPVERLVAVLEQDHEVKGDVTRQVMGWFGEVIGGQWKMDVINFKPSVVKCEPSLINLAILHLSKEFYDLPRYLIKDFNNFLALSC